MAEEDGKIRAPGGSCGCDDMRRKSGDVPKVGGNPSKLHCRRLLDKIGQRAASSVVRQWGI